MQFFNALILNNYKHTLVRDLYVICTENREPANRADVFLAAPRISENQDEEEETERGGVCGGEGEEERKRGW